MMDNHINTLQVYFGQVGIGSKKVDAWKCIKVVSLCCAQLLPLILPHLHIFHHFVLTVAKDYLCLMAHNVLCSAMNSAKNNPWPMIRHKKILFVHSLSYISIKLYIFFFFTFGCAHYIPFDLTDLTPLLPPPTHKHFYTHEWNRKWHFPASFVAHQSLLVCVMGRKKTLRGRPSWSGAGAFWVLGRDKGARLDSKLVNGGKHDLVLKNKCIFLNHILWIKNIPLYKINLTTKDEEFLVQKSLHLCQSLIEYNVENLCCTLFFHLEQNPSQLHFIYIYIVPTSTFLVSELPLQAMSQS